MFTVNEPALSDTQAAHTGLPARTGLGLKTGHFREVLGSQPDLGFFEVHAENYMVAGGPFHHFLELIREQYPLSLHGVGLSIGAEGPLDVQHLKRLGALIERYQPHSFSEHLAWSSHGPVFLNDLLPLAYDTPTLNRVCEHIDQVQNSLGRPMLLENPATYLAFQRSTIDEADFIADVIRRSGCGLLLDVNNVYVSCINHQRDPLAYLDALPLHAVGEIHLAGFAEDRDSLGDRLLIDDHGAPIDQAVWNLYRQVLERTGPVATLIERDNSLPAFSVLLAEARQADDLLMQAEGRS
ncbi:DUF692 domain-containing protein [Pseudomonas sp. TH06]|uniref:MNIO family bufferin maturase n=1 Tax=Pseudomonas sp. TH06 TaxID=2796372 RepID=UPI0019143917|nr:DUF692 domain-containing protein [Pseudomonas sp. TH06]MBK5530092.1 DUF692 domain-containing protein [Pseudomonas sp. TH06]